MKKLLLLCILTVPAIRLAAQDKTIYGSFIVADEVLKYKVTRSTSAYSFQLSTLQEQDGLRSLDTAKLSKTKAYFETIKSTRQNDSLYKANKDNLNLISQKLDLVKNLLTNKAAWSEKTSDIDKLLNSIAATKMDTLFAKSKTADTVYNLVAVLNTYNTFLRKAAEPQTSSIKVLSQLKIEDFRKILPAQVAELMQTTRAKAIEDIAAADSHTVDRLFYEIDTRLKFEDDEPITAHAILKKKLITIPVTYHNIKAKEPRSVLINFQVERLRLEFEDGTIKNISALLIPLYDKYKKEYGTIPLEARNNMPISIAGKFDNERMSNNHKIFIGNISTLSKLIWEEQNDTFATLKSKQIRQLNDEDAGFMLGELLSYEIKHETDKEDYSPRNCIVDLTEASPIAELKKEKGVRLFDARAYSDIVGLNDEDPNGLVQIEVSRKINIIKARKQSFFFIPKTYKTNYMGILTNVEPRLTFSKIEQNNRYYPTGASMLDTGASIAAGSNKFALNPLQVVRFQRWNIGTDVNILKCNWHNLGVNLQLNGYFGYGRTQMADSVGIVKSTTNTDSIINTGNRNIGGANATMWGLGAALEFKPDSRYNIILSYNMRWVDIFSNQYSFAGNLENRYHFTSLQGFRRLGNTEGSKVFFRFQYYWLHNSPKYNFYQLQLGYELNLFGGNNATTTSK